MFSPVLSVSIGPPLNSSGTDTAAWLALLFFILCITPVAFPFSSVLPVPPFAPTHKHLLTQEKVLFKKLLKGYKLDINQ
jgi:hypothetical protein